ARDIAVGLHHVIEIILVAVQVGVHVGIAHREGEAIAGRAGLPDAVQVAARVRAPRRGVHRSRIPWQVRVLRTGTGLVVGVLVIVLAVGVLVAIVPPGVGVFLLGARGIRALGRTHGGLLGALSPARLAGEPECGEARGGQQRQNHQHDDQNVPPAGLLLRLLRGTLRGITLTLPLATRARITLLRVALIAVVRPTITLIVIALATVIMALPLATLCLAAIRILLPPLLGCACAITRASLPPLAGALLCRRASSRLGPRIGARLSGTIAGRGIAGAAVLRWLRTRGAPALGAGIIRVVIVWLRHAPKVSARRRQHRAPEPLNKRVASLTIRLAFTTAHRGSAVPRVI